MKKEEDYIDSKELSAFNKVEEERKFYLNLYKEKTGNTHFDIDDDRTILYMMSSKYPYAYRESKGEKISKKEKRHDKIFTIGLFIILSPLFIFDWIGEKLDWIGEKINKLP